MTRKILGMVICTLLIAVALPTALVADEPGQQYGVRTETWYAYNAYDAGGMDEGPVSFPSDDPGNVTLLQPTSSSSFISGACFVNDTWYGCEFYSPPDYPDDKIWTIDPATGNMTEVGHYGLSDSLNGLAYDDSTHTLYGCTSTNLYTIDPATGSATLVGAMGNPGLMIGIASDGNGNLYGIDLSDDGLYHINTTTGAATYIGDTGLSLNYAQDMAYDKDNDTLYLSAFIYPLKGSDSAGLCPGGLRYYGGLFECNTTDGSTTLIGQFGITEVTGFAIPYEYETGPVPQDVTIAMIMEKWNLVSIPFNQTINKTAIMVTYAGDNYTWDDAVTLGVISDYIFGWNRTLQNYFLADTFEPGYAYWLYAYNNCTFWIPNITIIPDAYVTDLKTNWNIMSVPNIENVNKTDTIVNYGGVDYNWSDAVAAGIISDYIFGWDRAGQMYFMADVFAPGDGYWLYAYNDCVLKQPVT